MLHLMLHHPTQFFDLYRHRVEQQLIMHL
jgi:hypothetical protein